MTIYFVPNQGNYVQPKKDNSTGVVKGAATAGLIGGGLAIGAKMLKDKTTFKPQPPINTARPITDKIVNDTAEALKTGDFFKKVGTPISSKGKEMLDELVKATGKSKKVLMTKIKNLRKETPGLHGDDLVEAVKKAFEKGKTKVKDSKTVKKATEKAKKIIDEVSSIKTKDVKGIITDELKRAKDTVINFSKKASEKVKHYIKKDTLVNFAKKNPNLVKYGKVGLLAAGISAVAYIAYRGVKSIFSDKN